MNQCCLSLSHFSYEPSTTHSQQTNTHTHTHNASTQPATQNTLTALLGSPAQQSMPFHLLISFQLRDGFVRGPSLNPHRIRKLINMAALLAPPRIPAATGLRGRRIKHRVHFYTAQLMEQAKSLPLLVASLIHFPDDSPHSTRP